jgi:manganese/zinc/iron transport system permease protein
MLERHGARQVHVDAECVLYGAMQGVIWPTAPATIGELFSGVGLAEFPRQVTTLAVVCLLDALVVTLLFKELRISAFDPALAAAQGISPGLMHYLLMTLTAITTVAAFEAVGSILVVAMLIVPAAAAHLLTDRLAVMLILAAVLAAVAASGGYAAAASLSVDAAGMIGVALGALLVVVGLLAPRHGWLGRFLRWAALSVSILREDMLGMLYRFSELAPASAPALTPQQLREAVGGGTAARLALWRLLRRGEAARAGAGVRLTEPGRSRAADIIRSHRLWESYLVRHLGLRPDHVHGTATRLEHLTDETMQERLAAGTDRPRQDPHGREIPE